MSDKDQSSGLIKPIFIGVATTVLASLILYYLGIKEGDKKSGDENIPPKPLVPEPPALTLSRPEPPEFFTQRPATPSNTCPDTPGVFWMQSPNVWYGPFPGGEGIGFSSAGGFQIWNPNMINIYGTYGSAISYPDPYLQIPRNVWILLQGSRFYVCVDSSGYVFGSYR